jgi:hypothetical protein
VLLVFLGTTCARAAGPESVTTYHYDNYRTGWNSNETILTPADVNSSSFGLLQTVALDDEVDSQPLYMPGMTITAGQYQGTHDVVYVATANNTIYAIDAESGTLLLSPNFGPPIPSPLGCNNNGPNVGITSTPVIDPTSNTLYVMVYTRQNNAPVYQLHALDLGSLTDKVAPQLVTASHTLSDGSTFNFNAKYQRQRPGLLLANGNVYAGFGSFCDFGAKFSRGWLLGWQTGTLTPLTANNLVDTQATSPKSFFLSSIWMSGFGLSTDDWGNVLAVTGNSDPSGTTYDGVTNIQESVIKVSPDLSTVLDLFTPFNWSNLDQEDMDFGSGGVLVLPDQPGPYPHLAVAAGKSGAMFLMNEDHLGGYSSQSNNVLGTYSIGGCWCGPSYFVDPRDSTARIVSSGGSNVKVWKLQTSPRPALSFVTSSVSTVSIFGQEPGFFTTVSSNGTSSPIIWALSRPHSRDNPAIYLYAFNPETGSPNTAMNMLFKGQAGAWPHMGGNSNQVPVVANGEVFVASQNQLEIFGLIPPYPVTTVLTSNLNPSDINQAVTFTATVSPVSGTIPTGELVTFNDTTQGVVLGTAPVSSGVATFTISTLSLGSHSIKALYPGDGTFASSSATLSQVVQRYPATISLSSSLNPSVMGQSVSFAATVSTTDGVPTGTVTFIQNGPTGETTATVTLNNGQATYTKIFGLAGTKTLTVSYSGDSTNKPSTSSKLTQTVNQATTSTTLVSSKNPSVAGQSVQFTATVSSPTTTPTGQVTFMDGSSVLQTVNLSGGTASISTSTLSADSHNVTAVYNGTASIVGSTSSVWVQTVN